MNEKHLLRVFVAVIAVSVLSVIVAFVGMSNPATREYSTGLLWAGMGSFGAAAILFSIFFNKMHSIHRDKVHFAGRAWVLCTIVLSIYVVVGSMFSWPFVIILLLIGALVIFTALLFLSLKWKSGGGAKIPK